MKLFKIRGLWFKVIYIFAYFKTLIISFFCLLMKLLRQRAELIIEFLLWRVIMSHSEHSYKRKND